MKNTYKDFLNDLTEIAEDYGWKPQSDWTVYRIFYGEDGELYMVFICPNGEVRTIGKRFTQLLSKSFSDEEELKKEIALTICKELDEKSDASFVFDEVYENLAKRTTFEQLVEMVSNASSANSPSSVEPLVDFVYETAY